MSYLSRAFRVLLVLWAGSLWSVAIWVAPTLFHAQPDRQLAGQLAGQLFTIEAYVGLATAALALVLPGRSRFLWGYAAAGLLAGMHWVLRPAMAAAHAHGSAWGLSFLAWHGVSVVIYLCACLAVLLLVWNHDFR